MPRVTASSLKLLPICTHSYRDGIVFPPDPMGPKARAGSAVHRLNEMLVLGRLGVDYYPQDSLIENRVPGSETSRVYAMHEAWAAWWRGVGEPQLRPEVPYAFNTETRCARELVIAQRGYPYEPNEIYGTADAVLFDGETLTVYDGKTGSPMNVDRARKNHQMRFLGLCAAKVYSVETVRVVLQFISEDCVTEDGAELDWFDLEEYENSLCDWYARIGTEPPVKGNHCRDAWCKLRPTAKFPGCEAWAEEEKEAV